MTSSPARLEGSFPSFTLAAQARLTSGSPPPPPASPPLSPSMLRLGTWNLSTWSPAKAQIILADIGVDILAVQETHLAAFPLECAHGTARNLGLHLHHGHPVPPTYRGVYGRSCGVGFVARRGVAVSPVVPVGAAWRRLHAMGRVHAVRVPPRPGLPRGILLLTVYAPLQVRAQEAVREQFVSLMLEVTHGLDLQVPTFILGDFNGSVDPPRDFLSQSGSRRPVCPLLAHLLGPGAAWVDVCAAVQPQLEWTYRHTDSSGQLAASRIDLILASHSAVPLVKSASVLTAVQDGGHSPVLLDVHLVGPTMLEWHRPRPRLPPLLQLDYSTLCHSDDWQSLVQSWVQLPSVAPVLDPHSSHSLSSLSSALVAALQALVALAGGWDCRPPPPTAGQHMILMPCALPEGLWPFYTDCMPSCRSLMPPLGPAVGLGLGASCWRSWRPSRSTSRTPPSAPSSLPFMLP